jgi:hypothetical protein
MVLTSIIFWTFVVGLVALFAGAPLVDRSQHFDIRRPSHFPPLAAYFPTYPRVGPWRRPSGGTADRPAR